MMTTRKFAIETPATDTTLLVVEARTPEAALAQVDSAPGTKLRIWTLGGFPGEYVRMADGSLVEIPRAPQPR